MNNTGMQHRKVVVVYDSFAAAAAGGAEFYPVTPPPSSWNTTAGRGGHYNNNNNTSRNNVASPPHPASIIRGSHPYIIGREEGYYYHNRITFDDSPYQSMNEPEPVTVHENDVLMGRGGKNNQHSGNEKLRELAREHSANYRESSKKGKSAISRDLVQQMRELDPPARFLKRNNNSGEWEDVGDEIAREKASQVLRDAVALLPDDGHARHHDDDDDDEDDIPEPIALNLPAATAAPAVPTLVTQDEMDRKPSAATTAAALMGHPEYHRSSVTPSISMATSFPPGSPVETSSSRKRPRPYYQHPDYHRPPSYGYSRHGAVHPGYGPYDSPSRRRRYDVPVPYPGYPDYRAAAVGYSPPRERMYTQHPAYYHYPPTHHPHYPPPPPHYAPPRRSRSSNAESPTRRHNRHSDYPPPPPQYPPRPHSHPGASESSRHGPHREFPSPRPEPPEPFHSSPQHPSPSAEATAAHPSSPIPQRPASYHPRTHHPPSSYEPQHHYYERNPQSLRPPESPLGRHSRRGDTSTYVSPLVRRPWTGDRNRQASTTSAQSLLRRPDAIDSNRQASTASAQSLLRRPDAIDSNRQASTASAQSLLGDVGEEGITEFDLFNGELLSSDIAGSPGRNLGGGNRDDALRWQQFDAARRRSNSNSDPPIPDPRNRDPSGGRPL